ncbi:MAG: hypothetical protein HYZ50_02590 [Deltaproteobacteria bacterium]|nr:hypothetical protein [Deltaproteobacteria bacterium]
MKILFSKKQEWESTISMGFQATSHELVFEEFSPANIGNSDLVVPLTVRDTRYLAEMRPLVARNPLPIPSLESIELCNNKSLFNRTLMDNGFERLIPQIGGTLPYPYILKKNIDEWGKNSHIVWDARQERDFSDILAHPDYFRQAIIPGPTEYATHILFKDRKVAWALNVKYVFAIETPIKGKDPILSTVLCPCPYLDLFSSVLRFLGFEGLCCINYKVLDDRPFLFEINPRFGGSLCPFFPFFLRHLH